jgi:deoxyhypusine synthase
MTRGVSLFKNAPDIVPVHLDRGMTIADLVERIGGTAFEARNLALGAGLYSRMIREGDIIWLGIAGAGIAGGMGGIVISLLEAGFIDVICSTGAQVYHDLHFAFGLPVKAVSPRWDDDALRAHGDTRIYDIGIREKETLEAQDEIIRKFVSESYPLLEGRLIASWEFNNLLGKWVIDNAPFPERSFVALAARLEVPVFWDSMANHSIAMNLLRMDLEGCVVSLHPQNDVLDSAAIVYAAEGTGFVELGGGGPKNFIQQTGPTISQILGVPFEGADRGLQIGTAVEREGSLSGCTFGEAVTWGKYQNVDDHNLVQIWGEYSIVLPLVAAYALDKCDNRPGRKLAAGIPEMREVLIKAL